VNPFFHLAPRGWLRKRELDPLPENFSQDEKPKNLILNLPLHFFSGSGGKVSHSKRI
jgi:hypothetical protein